MPLILQQTKFAEEGGHFYTLDGTPAYTVIGANGKQRPTTLADARKLALVPSVTTITKVAAQPGLSAWIVKQTLLAALTLPRKEGESLDDFSVRAMQDSREQTKKAADRGSSLHGALERAVGHPNLLGPEWGQHVKAVQQAMQEAGLAFHEGIPEKSFASPEGYGGKLDWHCPTAVADFKSKPRIEPGAKLAWPEHIMQLAAYANGLGLVNPRLVNIFVGVEDAKVHIHEWTPEDAINGLAKFRCLLRFWQLERGLLKEAA